MLTSIQNKTSRTNTLFLAALSLALPLSAAYAGNAPQVGISGAAQIPMRAGEVESVVALTMDFGSGKPVDTTCFKVTAQVAGLDLDHASAEFRPYTHCDPAKSRFDRWGHAMASVSRDMRLRKDLKVTISLLGVEGELKSGDPENDEFFFGIVQTVLGAEFLRASGFDGAQGAENMVGLMLDSGKLYGGFNRKLDKDKTYRFTVGLAADVGVVHTAKRALTLTGDASGFIRAAIILKERATQIELFLQGTASTFAIGTTPGQPDYTVDAMFGVEVSQ
jgi:hypothetical protein